MCKHYNRTSVFAVVIPPRSHHRKGKAENGARNEDEIKLYAPVRSSRCGRFTFIVMPCASIAREMASVRS